MLLEVNNISLHYQAVLALQDVSIVLGQGELIALIGSNGAGKSSTLKAISGLKKISSGEIRLRGSKIDGLGPHEIVKLGISHVPEGRRVFPYMSTFENLKMGTFLRTDKVGIAEDYESVYHHFPILYNRRNQEARTLSGGEQQLLAIGRALMARPQVLLMDEPSLGLAPVMVQEIAKVIANIRKRMGVSILLVEQNARLALKLADRGYVLATGKVVLHGPAHDLQNNEKVRKAYMGR